VIHPDSSGYEGGIGASAVLYKGPNVIKTLRYYLGTDDCHMVYEAEGVGVYMVLHLLTSLGSRIGGAAILGTDSQALVKATKNQRPHTGHYILDEIHNVAEKLHMKQDELANRQERMQRIQEGR
jgi:hypothetical protein